MLIADDQASAVDPMDALIGVTSEYGPEDENQPAKAGQGNPDSDEDEQLAGTDEPEADEEQSLDEQQDEQQP